MYRMDRMLYWTLTGVIMGVGLVGAWSIGLPFLFIGLIMAIYGLIRIGRRGFWVVLICFGIIPSALMLFTYFMTKRCPTGCGYIPDSTFNALGVSFGVIALIGALWGLIDVIRGGNEISGAKSH